MNSHNEHFDNDDNPGESSMKFSGKNDEDDSYSEKSKTYDAETGTKSETRREGSKSIDVNNGASSRHNENNNTCNQDSVGSSNNKPINLTKMSKSGKDESSTSETDVDYFPSPNIKDATAFEAASFWSENTSIHGAYYVLERGHFRVWKKVVWTAIELVAAIGLLIVLALEFQEFSNYDVKSSTAAVVPTSLPFPEVTICNTNMYDSYLQNATGILQPENDEELNAISQPFEDFILDTAFNVKDYVNLTDAWTPVITPFGRCYTFSTDDQVFVPGSAAGLDVSLWLNQSAYEDATLAAGVYVFVTQKGTTITEQAPMVVVPPGAASFISVSLTKYEREQDEPWSRCVGKAPKDSSQACRANCINELTVQKCGCRILGDSLNPGLRYCNSSDFNCTLKASIDEELLLCTGCSVPPCEEEVYFSQYSAARISIKAAQSIENEYNSTRDEMTSFASNYVRILVNYRFIEYELMTESKATSTSQLISNLGGNFGFFMGISMISIIEFMELLCLRLLPRLWGNRQLFGIGQKQKFD
mmetsp:Transcript_30923/g.45724  ORF Transcript_30923/g.45724 Transcript_30923/m.45724 type:complete len:531 (+) Transcript_30923:125-1717(+)|eukprot:CAMPEP_0194215432 /NCGR_PEP_ID=MMETSP0156-20130528/17229_1 /TAXON_ID=33649 /ORGANISM="Thalassionema nitzschioides, Strain L26-B" /LENGTH=530 /DNA_ID=CAMNT_0038943941 /DNA_START=82 /DNA_END=1674 /DNA_ORIENTATION=+